LIGSVELARGQLVVPGSENVVRFNFSGRESRCQVMPKIWSGCLKNVPITIHKDFTVISNNAVFFLPEIPNADLVLESASKAVMLSLHSRMAPHFVPGSWLLAHSLCHPYPCPNRPSLGLKHYVLRHSRSGLSVIRISPFLEIQSIAAFHLQLPLLSPLLKKAHKTPFPSINPQTVAHHFVPTPLLQLDFCHPRKHVCCKDKGRADY